MILYTASTITMLFFYILDFISKKFLLFYDLYLLSYIFHLPCQQSCPPGKSRSETRKDHLISPLQFAAFVHLIQQDRYTCRRSISVLLQIHREFFFRFSQSLRHRADEMCIRDRMPDELFRALHLRFTSVVAKRVLLTRGNPQFYPKSE